MARPAFRYSFEISDIICGAMDVYRSDEYLRSVTDFETPAFGHVVAEFEYYHDNDRVVRARKVPFDWVDFTVLNDDAFPDCAYPTLIQRALREDFDYRCIDLEGMAGLDRRRIARTDNLVFEARGGQVLRKFTLRDGVPVHINWGGAISNLLAAHEHP